MERNMYLIDHSKTQHLNGSKLHLNSRGARILQNIVCNFLSNISNWCFEENSVKIATVTSTVRLSGENVHHWNEKGGGIILHIWDDIQSRLVSTEPSSIEGFFVEINLRNKKK